MKAINHFVEIPSSENINAGEQKLADKTCDDDVNNKILILKVVID